MSDLKVSAGDPVRAQAWNQVIDRITGSESGTAASVAQLGRILVPVLNSSGRDYDIGEVFKIKPPSGVGEAAVGGSFVIGGATATSNVYDAATHLEYECITPDGYSDIDNLLIAAEPIPNGERGSAVLWGHCIIKTSTTDAGLYLSIDPASPHQCLVERAGIARYCSRVSDDYVYAVLGQAHTNLWCRSPQSGIFGRVGMRQGKGVCTVYTVDYDPDTEDADLTPLLDSNGDQVEVTVHHGGAGMISGSKLLDVQRQGGLWVPVVEYCVDEFDV